MDYLSHKVRHPYHTLSPYEMIVGEEYSLISQRSRGGIEDVSNYFFGGLMEDSLTTAKNRNYDLRTKDIKPVAFTDTQGKNVVKNILTVHMDGWYSIGNKSSSMGVETIQYWRKDRVSGYDILSTFFVKEDQNDWCYLVLPTKKWNDDPKIHVLDWINPNDIIERLSVCQTTIPLDWEQAAKKKQNELWAKMFE